VKAEAREQLLLSRLLSTRILPRRIQAKAFWEILLVLWRCLRQKTSFFTMFHGGCKPPMVGAYTFFADICQFTWLGSWEKHPGMSLLSSSLRFLKRAKKNVPTHTAQERFNVGSV